LTVDRLDELTINF